MLVVGLALPPCPEYEKVAQQIQKINEGMKQKPVGHARPESTIVLRETDIPPILVVTPIDVKQCDAVKLFVLLDNAGDMYFPYNISQSAVFYFHEYRGRETSVSFRAREWNKNVSTSARIASAQPTALDDAEAAAPWPRIDHDMRLNESIDADDSLGPLSW